MERGREGSAVRRAGWTGWTGLTSWQFSWHFGGGNDNFVMSRVKKFPQGSLVSSLNQNFFELGC